MLSKIRALMLDLAKKLSIPERSAREMLHEVLSGYVQTKSGTKAGMGLRAGLNG